MKERRRVVIRVGGSLRNGMPVEIEAIIQVKMD